MESLSGKFGLNIIRVNAQERFLSKLKGVSDPEQKRKLLEMNSSMYSMMKQQN